MAKTMIIAVDFDGTCVEHRYPDIGRDEPHCVKWLKRWTELGARLILFTMRHDSESQGPVLTQAVEWFKEREIALWGINENPEQHTWSDSRKVYAHLYIDDAAYGCPVYKMMPYDGRPVVNWSIIGPEIEKQLISQQDGEGV